MAALAGFIFGVLLMSLMAVASRADELMEGINEKEREQSC